MSKFLYWCKLRLGQKEPQPSEKNTQKSLEENYRGRLLWIPRKSLFIALIAQSATKVIITMRTNESQNLAPYAESIKTFLFYTEKSSKADIGYWPLAIRDKLQ